MSYRDEAGDLIESDLEWLDADVVVKGSPVRMPPAYAGQKNYPGLFWSSTTGSHVVYESLLELQWLWEADFDPSALWIAAQPFWLVGADGASLRRHVPDFMVKTGSGFRVIDVKPTRLVSRPQVADVFAWTRKICSAMGWDYQVWTGADAVRYRNLLFIARGRRRFLIPDDVVEMVLSSSERPSTLGEFIRVHSLAVERAEVLAVMFHLLWTHRIE